MKKLLSVTDTKGKPVQMFPADLAAARQKLRKLAAEVTARQGAAWQSAQKVNVR